MEENINPNTPSEVSSQAQMSQSAGVSFPTVGDSKKSGSGKTFLIIGTLILVAVLGFIIFKSAGNKEIENTEPTPIEGVTEDTVSTPAATTSPTPKAIVRSGISVEVQNGTGIPGEAAFLQNQLKTLGYTDVKTANAKEIGATTKVTFLKSLSQDVIDELTKKLNELYKTVDATTSATGSTNVVIITGLKKGATLPPSASPTATGTATPTPTPTPTAGT
ncbi:MAG: LytR C-terminal domain-containing protein [bacterium]|nr:LytR C-terminal domain-containing protein [bacterium]